MNEKPTKPEPTKVFIHLENICNRIMLEIEKVKDYVVKNGYELTDKREEASKVLLFGCAFNNFTETQSKNRLDEFLDTKTEGQEIFVLEGLADTMGKKLIKEKVIEEAFVIRTGNFKKLDQHFNKTVAYEKIPEMNRWGQTEKSQGLEPRFMTGMMSQYSIQVGHGCNDNCAFCGDKVVVKNIRSKPLEKIVCEFKKGLELGHQHINLMGDDVGAYGIDCGKTFVDLMDAVLAIPGDYTVGIAELNTKYLVKYKEHLDRFFESGHFNSISLAFQSGNSRILDLMRRHITREDILDVVKTCHKYKVVIHAHCIIGFPTETDQDYMDSLTLVDEGKLSSVTFFLYQDRHTASASRLDNKVSEKKKLERLDLTENFFKERDCKVIRRPDKVIVQFSDIFN